MLGGGGRGPWEVALRYGDLKLNWQSMGTPTPRSVAFAESIRGGEEKIWTVGVNWYPSDNIRLMAHYLIGDVERLNEASAPTGRHSTAVTMRLQFTN